MSLTAFFTLVAVAFVIGCQNGTPGARWRMGAIYAGIAVGLCIVPIARGE